MLHFFNAGMLSQSWMGSASNATTQHAQWDNSFILFYYPNLAQFIHYSAFYFFIFFFSLLLSLLNCSMFHLSTLLNALYCYKRWIPVSSYIHQYITHISHTLRICIVHALYSTYIHYMYVMTRQRDNQLVPRLPFIMRSHLSHIQFVRNKFNTKQDLKSHWKQIATCVKVCNEKSKIIINENLIKNFSTIGVTAEWVKRWALDRDEDREWDAALLYPSHRLIESHIHVSGFSSKQSQR